MIVQKNFLVKLRGFGLNSYEAKLWTALLSRGVSTAGELSDIASVPRSRSYDVLESLEKKGFIMVKLGKPIKYVAVEPEDVLVRLKKKVLQDAEEQTKLIKELETTDTLSELNAIYEKGKKGTSELETMSGTVKGKKNFYDYLSLQISNSQKSVTILTTADGFRKKTEHLLPAFTKARKRGAGIRIAVHNLDKSYKLPKEMEGIAELRESHIPGRFVIVDGKTAALIMNNNGSKEDEAIWSNTPFLATALEKTFDDAWARMKPVK